MTIADYGEQKSSFFYCVPLLFYCYLCYPDNVKEIHGYLRRHKQDTYPCRVIKWPEREETR